MFNYHGTRKHTEEAIVVWHEGARADEIAQQCPDGQEITTDWRKDVNGTSCLWLRWCNEDFQPVAVIVEAQSSSTKRKAREGQEEGRAANVQRRQAGPSATGSASRTRPNRQAQLEALEARKRELEEIWQKQEAVQNRIIEDCESLEENNEDKALSICHKTQIELARNALRHIGERREELREEARLAAREAQDPNWRSLSAEAEAAPRFCALSAEGEESGPQLNSLASSVKEEEEGDVEPPEALWMELVQSLRALDEARVPPQLQQLHEEYQAMYRAIFAAA